MEIGMKKLSILLAIILFYSCEGPAGEDGQDGVANMHTQIIEMTTNNTEFVANPGFLRYVYESSFITQDVVDSGLVFVELSQSNNPYNWNPLPFIVYDGDNSDVNYMQTCDFSYGVGSLEIIWSSSEYLQESEWLSLATMWQNFYKITIITPN
tara:strand:- start:40 stop:498 length:459 start_codon:yes stop_codon:yes gene_type:complete